ncbi:MAG TPA: hypothetical protein VN915_06550 [Elusimicrobiota bacterium]|nr:hypothetical protein [Elusimicrobiota bacterium]
MPAVWLISGPVLFLYVVAIASIWALREANDRICTASSREKPLAPAAVVLLTAVSNLLAVATLVLCARGLETTPRLSMLAVPAAVLLERYGRLIYRAPSRRRDPVSGLLGSLGGLAAGAWLFMRASAGPEQVVRAAVSGSVQTVPFAEAMAHDAPWAVSLSLAGFYLLSLAIFFGIHALLKRTGPKLLGDSARPRAGGAAQALALAFALNFLGVAALVLAANASDVRARLAMVGFPLFLIVEAYVELLKKEKARRRSHWSGLAGSAGGMVLAGWFLLRGAPLR